MSCPTDEILVSLHDGSSADLDADACRRHVSACPTCHRRLEAWTRLDALLGAPDPASEELRERILALPDARPARLSRVTVAVLAAAAAVLVAWAVTTRTTEGPSRAAPSIADSPGTVPPTVSFPVRLEAALLALDEADQAEVLLDEAGLRALPALHRFVRGPDARLARQAIRRLGDLAGRASLPALLDALAHEDRRTEALAALGAIGDDRAVPHLEAWLGKPSVGGAALEAIVAIGGTEAARALERRVASMDDLEAARPLVAHLGGVDGRVGALALARLAAGASELAGDARRALVESSSRLLPHLLALAGDRDKDEAATALEALRLVPSPEAVPALEALLSRRTRRAAAARVLARIDTPASAATLFAHAAVPGVARAFADVGPTTEAWLLERLDVGPRRDRLRAAELLGLCGSEASVADLRAVADDPALAPTAIASLGQIGGDAAVAALDEIAERPASRTAVIAALGRTRSLAAVESLHRLGRLERRLRDPAIRALARIPHTRAVEVILRLDDRERPRPGTTRALEGMDAELVHLALTSMLEGDRGRAARNALDAVGLAGAPPPPLLRLAP